jgi:hypothetical protein
MRDLMIEQIERRTRLEHGGAFAKAAREYFRDHPEYYPEYTKEVSGVSKRDSDDGEAVNGTVQLRMEMVACRDKLDLDKPADRVAAQAKVLAEDPSLYKRYRVISSPPR